MAGVFKRITKRKIELYKRDAITDMYVKKSWKRNEYVVCEKDGMYIVCKWNRGEKKYIRLAYYSSKGE